MQQVRDEEEERRTAEGEGEWLPQNGADEGVRVDGGEKLMGIWGTRFVFKGAYHVCFER